VSRFTFRLQPQDKCPSSERVRVLIENVEYLDSRAFVKDRDLYMELQQMEGFQRNPLGIVLISSNESVDYVREIY